MGNLDVDVQHLISESNRLSSAMQEAIKSVDAAYDLVQLRQEQWDSRYNDFLSREHTITPPTGKWNDDKRKAYVMLENQELWDELQAAKSNLKMFERQVKQLSEQISAFNRNLRVLEIAVGDDRNALTMLQIGVTRV